MEQILVALCDKQDEIEWAIANYKKQIEFAKRDLSSVRAGADRLWPHGARNVNFNPVIAILPQHLARPGLSMKVTSCSVIGAHRRDDPPLLSAPARFEMTQGERALAHAARQLGVSLVEGQRAYGFHKKSTGAPIICADASMQWLRVTGSIGTPQEAAHAAEMAADQLSELAKPRIIRWLQWKEGDVFWRAVLMTKAAALAAGNLPWRDHGAEPLADDWYDELRRSLAALHDVRSGPRMMTPHQVEALIRSQFDDGAPTVAECWQVAHGDLQWSNVTAPNFALLDWERWGFAPKGYDSGRMLAFSVLDPVATATLKSVFAEDFSSRSGRVGMLAAIAEVKIQLDDGSYDARLKEPLAQLTQEIVERDRTGRA